MYRCPNCGRGMTNHMEPSLTGGGRVVWTCICGYNSYKSNYFWDDKPAPPPEGTVSADSVPLVEKRRKK